ncbi:HlyD family efflux transporter periplasmic adaptor subunit [Hydrogenophaga sp. SNF1]|uniref:HlyD family efflux transporter periplasmic adaptor subunit n=1 Tax=Hydrogenophaga sp. SNF1 TaxID=3098762 RepID=UPI002ACBE6FE|nr:HlyD family efflux transporter periplasmic adaptor subunit [Hydrogenophaga sp. SNF1]WQB81807.1 HlyD family efflux transporter periplasmic adaptor subunit [Hydrogenophaga sp. SNF1]
MASIACATAIEVEKVVRAEGQVRSVAQSAHIVAPLAGRIQSVQVSEGDFVHQGDRLMTIEPDANGLSVHQARLNMIRHASAYGAYSGLSVPVEPLDSAEIETQRIVRRAVEAELLAANARLETVKGELMESLAQEDVEAATLRRREALQPIARERLERHAELVRKGFQSHVSLLAMQQDAVDAGEQVLIARKRLAHAKEDVGLHRAALSAARMEVDRIRRQKAAETHAQFLQASAEFQRLTDLSRNSAIESPADGVIEHVSEQVAGNAVRAGERLMSVVPVRTPLELQLRVRNEDYPFVKPGQAIDVKFEAYPFTIYGSRPAVVVRVLREVLPGDERLADYVAIARLTPASDDLQALDIRHGMKLIADIEVGKQRPIDIWLDPFLRFGNEAFRERR